MRRRFPIAPLPMALWAAVALADEKPDEKLDQNSRVRAAVSEEGVRLSEGDSPVLFYQRRTKSQEGRYPRADYVHPLYGLDGAVLTEDFPADHRHHRGVFWAWHQLYVGDRAAGDPWICQDVVWDVREARIANERSGAATLEALVLWKSPHWTDEAGEPKPLVEQTTRIRAAPKAEGLRKIDFELRLKALEKDVRLGGSDDAKGYGGFCVRIRLPEDIRFTANYGQAEPKRTAVEPSPWMDMTGSLGKDGSTAGVTVLCHPSNPGFPHPWILRRARSMQNPAWPGREPAPLSTEEPLVLRYRLVLHSGPAKLETIDGWQAEYAENR